MTAKVLGRMLEMANMPFLYYYGNVNSFKRADALRVFQEPEGKVRIMVRGEPLAQT